MGLKRLVCLVLSGVLLLAGCESGPDTIDRVEGIIESDAEEGQPVAGATVATESHEVESSQDGRFSLRDVEAGAELRVSACGYEPAVAQVPEADDSGPLEISLTPLSIEGSVVGNLTEKPLKAKIKGPSGKVSTDARGSFGLKGVCEGDSLEISAPGFSAKKVTYEESSDLDVILAAGPGETLKQIARWQAQQEWARLWAQVHPDAHNYISKQEWIEAAEQSVLDGFQDLKAKIEDVQRIAWTFPRCSVADYGPKVYKNAAAVSATVTTALPAGGREKSSRVSHLVRTKNGLWRWFPTTGCDH